MGLWVGPIEIGATDLYLGNQPLTALYVGAIRVWPVDLPPVEGGPRVTENGLQRITEDGLDRVIEAPEAPVDRATEAGQIRMTEDDVQRVTERG